MTVLRLVENDDEDTRDALMFLLHEAETGDLNLLATFSRPGGVEKALFTGSYKARPELAVMAALRLTTALIKAKKDNKP